jgi:zinc protease
MNALPLFAMLASSVTPTAAATVTVTATATPAAPTVPTATPQVSIPFEKYVIPDNGLEVILGEDHSLPIVAVNIWYHVGPVNEAPGRTGFAHLFEHLMFQGSAHVGDDQHFRLLDAAGASQSNGTTDFDRTNYFETVPRNQLALALWLESDRMGFLLDTFTQQKLDLQRSVVMNERRQSVDNVPYGASEERLVQLLFAPDHPYYGNVIGSMVDLTAATLDDVSDFFTRYYAPANATLSIVGDIDVRETKALVAKYFGTLPRRDPPAPRPVVTQPLTAEKRLMVKEAVQLPRVAMAWLTPPAFAPGDADCDVLAFVLGGGRSSRLYRKLVYELQLAQDVSASQESLALTSIFRVVVTGRPGVDPRRLEAETQKVLDEIRAAAPSPQEVARARAQLTTALVASLQNVGGIGGKADTLNRYNQYAGDPGYFETDLGRYQRVTPASVLAIAKKILDTHARAVVVTVAP